MMEPVASPNHSEGEIFLKRRRIYGPDVRLIEKDGILLVEKTYRDRPLPVRVAGRLLIRWETFVYSKLSGIPGIPGLATSPDRYTITTTFMGGGNLRARARRTPDSRYFDELERLIDAVHERGVIHLDLRNRRNYGIDDTGRPYLVDFASSLYLPNKGLLWRLLRHIDLMGLAKLKAKVNPALIRPGERRAHALGRTLSRLWIPPRVLRFVRGWLSRILRRP